jgi:hypothetical protein
MTYTMNALSASGGGTLTLGAAYDSATGHYDLNGLTPTMNTASISTSGGAATTVYSATLNTNSVALSGGTNLTLSSQAQLTMNVVKTFAMSGGGQLNLPTDASLPAPASVDLNIVNTVSVSTPLDFSGGTIANASYDSSRFVIEYPGSGNISLSGGTKQAQVLYAPNAAVTISGGASLYGEVVSSTLTDSGGTQIFYDRNLMNKGIFKTTSYYSGNPMLSSFSWKKF